MDASQTVYCYRQALQCQLFECQMCHNENERELTKVLKLDFTYYASAKVRITILDGSLGVARQLRVLDGC